MASSPNPRELLDTSPMSRTQKIAILLTSLLSALDGYDILSISFAAPAISAEWGISKAALGLVFSSGLLGMMGGSFLLAPLGDRIGRRAIVIIALVLMGSGMALCATAHSTATLALWRVVTGIGLGAMVAVINPLAVEFANARFRTMAVAVMSIGFPLGGMVGGFVAAALLKSYSWEAVFIFGAVASAVALPLVLIWLPESPSFLLTRRDPKSLDRVNALLRKCGHDPVAALPLLPVARPKAPYREIFSGAQLLPTLWITGANFLFMMATYFFLSWMPQIVADKGFDPSTASTMSAIANMFGVISCLMVGIAALYLPLRRLVAGLALAMGFAVIAFGFAPSNFHWLTFAAALVGICLFAGTTGIYTLIASTFEPRMRVTGGGFAMGMGRVAGTLAPSIAGMLFGTGASLEAISIILGSCAVLSGLLLGISRLAPLSRRLA